MTAREFFDGKRYLFNFLIPAQGRIEFQIHMGQCKRCDQESITYM